MSKKVTKRNKMTHKQEQFIAYYVTGNIRDAAGKAGISYKYARKLVTFDHIKAAIDAKRRQLMEKVDIDSQWLLERLIKLDSFDMRKCYDEFGNHRDIKDLDDETAYAINSLKVFEIIKEKADGSETETKRTMAIKTDSKRSILETIGKVIGAFIDRKEVSGPKGGPIDVRYNDVDGAEKTEKLYDLGNRLIEELAKK